MKFAWHIILELEDRGRILDGSDKMLINNHIHKINTVIDCGMVFDGIKNYDGDICIAFSDPVCKSSLLMKEKEVNAVSVMERVEAKRKLWRKR